MAEARTLNEHYAELGQSLVESEPLLAPILDSSVTICYLGSDYAKRSKGRTVFGECERVAEVERRSEKRPSFNPKLHPNAACAFASRSSGLVSSIAQTSSAPLKRMSNDATCAAWSSIHMSHPLICIMLQIIQIGGIVFALLRMLLLWFLKLLLWPFALLFSIDFEEKHPRLAAFIEWLCEKIIFFQQLRNLLQEMFG